MRRDVIEASRRGDERAVRAMYAEAFADREWWPTSVLASKEAAMPDRFMLGEMAPETALMLRGQWWALRVELRRREAEAVAAAAQLGLFVEVGDGA